MSIKRDALKPCRWVGSAKPFKGVGSGVLEIVDDHDGDTYRCVYLLRLKEVVYVLHAFPKKSKTGKKTPPKDIEMIKSWIKLAEDDYKKRPAT